MFGSCFTVASSVLLFFYVPKMSNSHLKLTASLFSPSVSLIFRPLVFGLTSWSSELLPLTWPCGFNQNKTLFRKSVLSNSAVSFYKCRLTVKQSVNKTSTSKILKTAKNFQFSFTHTLFLDHLHFLMLPALKKKVLCLKILNDGSLHKENIKDKQCNYFKCVLMFSLFSVVKNMQSDSV